jgi:hypothetical protein
MHGHGKEALKHFEQKCEEGVQPDDTTFFVFCQLVPMQDWWIKAWAVYASMITDYMIPTKLEH